ncbi:hypothetical protein SAMD00019534_046480 [Acytostelium subglobosum LB1]|uniref:hypothetical protein n=1 Tax=Acytostelium subglobosum LB1 TaxID=1410327 RepID=UPI0006448490|nr:hypothetical protein SAMD00019534_046480 [Acytostelium subglobosum LB1]GAM21473.1 hypothetical protein SAMD00019534_046480 [Acytostelium subglobosum LB1]|eukprot:XP_012755592.1 hypothetical protein SAMD00019534_046480 [Acytostelium subglobosum LB1]
MIENTITINDGAGDGLSYDITPTSMSFRNVGYTITKNNKPKNIISNIWGNIEPGDFVAIVGPSGSGKTTLLDVLVERKTIGDVYGDIIVNNSRMTNDIQHLCGYVTQEDVFLPTLTVSEVLYYYANLKLASHVSVDEKAKLIESVLRTVGLNGKEDYKIGGLLPGGNYLRGLSGGEKKRLNIGCSLVMAPSFIVLDEPTSGLDSTSALQVVQTLQRLCRKGVTVVCTIHQPRMEILSMFTKFLLIVKGTQLYFGRDIFGYFENKGYTCPSGMNSMDFLMDSMIHLENNNRTVFDEMANDINTIISPNINSVINNVLNDEKLIVNDSPQKKYAGNVSMFTQIRVIFVTSAIHTLRNPGNFFLRTLVSVVVALLFGACFYQLGYNQTQLLQRVAIMYSVITSLQLTPFKTISLFLESRYLYNKERASKVHSAFSYFFSYIMCELIMSLIVAIVFTTIVYWIAGLRSTPSAFFFALLVNCLIHLWSVLFIVFLSNVTGTSDNTFSVGSGFTIIYQLFLGFLVPVKSLPVGFAWIHYLNPLYYAFNAWIISEFEGIEFPCTPGEVCFFNNGSELIEFYGSKDFTKAGCVSILVAFLVSFYIFSYLALRFFSKERR